MKKTKKTEIREATDAPTADNGDDDTNEVTPDTMIVCPKCHLRIRVGRRMGGD